MQKKLNVKASDFAVKLSKQFFDDAQTQGLAVDSYLDKRPKTYVETYKQLYLLSVRLRFFFHFCSLVVALPFLNYFAVESIVMSTGATPPPSTGWIIGIIVLAVAETCQSKTLDTLFNVYFQDAQKLVIGLVLIAGFFSAFSIFSSGYSAFTLFEGNQTFKYIGVVLSIGIELCIIFFTFNIHNFRYKTAKTLLMLNDFSQHSAAQLPSTVPYFDAPIETATKIATPKTPKLEEKETKKVNGHVLFTAAQNNDSTANQETLDSTKKVSENSSKLPSTASTVGLGTQKTWTYNEVKAERKRYANRLKEKDTTARRVGAFFFDFCFKNWKELATDDKMVFIPINVRKAFYQNKDIQTIKNYINSN